MPIRHSIRYYRKKNNSSRPIDRFQPLTNVLLFLLLLSYPKLVLNYNVVDSLTQAHQVCF